MIGGSIVDIVKVRNSRWWIQVADTRRGAQGLCSLYIDPKGHDIQVGDRLWWQGTVAFWTSHRLQSRDVMVPKLSFAGDMPHPDLEPPAATGTKLAIVLALCLLATPAAAQQLPTAGERHAADVASWATAVLDLALDTRASWQAPDRGRAFMLEGARIGITYAAVLSVKRLVHRARPCAPDCGTDLVDSSFYSGHTAIAFSTLGGPRLAVTLPLAIGTGGLRVAAGKHWITDVLTGAAAGALVSRLR